MKEQDIKVGAYVRVKTREWCEANINMTFLEEDQIKMLDELYFGKVKKVTSLQGGIFGDKIELEGGVAFSPKLLDYALPNFITDEVLD